MTNIPLGTLVGHSDLVTGLVFSYDSRFLITVSGDSCIFVWRLPRKMVNTMFSKLDLTVAEEAPGSLEVVEEEEFGSPPKDLFRSSEHVSPQTMYRFSVGKLPIWARKKVTDQDVQSTTSSPMVNSSPRGKWGSMREHHVSEGEDILKRFQEEDDEPDVGSVDKTKKLLFQKDDEDGKEEFMVNAIDADTLRKSQRGLVIPPSAESSLVNDELEDLDKSGNDYEEEDISHAVKVENTSSINFLQEDADNSENVTKKKPSSISHAWREGLTPVQQRKNGVSVSTNISIEKLLANNQLHAMLKNATPTKSPCVKNSAFHDPSQEESSKLPGSLSRETMGSGVKVDSTKGQLSKNLIKVGASLYCNLILYFNFQGGRRPSQGSNGSFVGLV